MLSQWPQICAVKVVYTSLEAVSPRDKKNQAEGPHRQKLTREIGLAACWEIWGFLKLVP